LAIFANCGMDEKGDHMDKLKTFITQRIVVGLLLAIAILWLFSTIMGILNKPASDSLMGHTSDLTTPVPLASSAPAHSAVKDISHPNTDSHTVNSTTAGVGEKHPPVENGHSGTETLVQEKEAVPVSAPHGTSGPKPASDSVHSASVPDAPVSHEKMISGVAFVQAAQKPLRYELEDRFWGWRPNDIINITDNVNNYQLGILEVTRRTAVILAERMSRTGSVESFDKNLEHAMDWFMTKPDRYWFPSPENRYIDALDDWSIYVEKLKRGEASFYTRPDNLIPLLAAYANLLGSCDENLVKTKEGSGDPVSWFQVDDYFYYAKGVVSALHVILEAVHEDFHQILETRHGTELLHHAILSCQRASEIEPWLITDADLSGILANHRANMAAPVSHARFYLDVLIATLST